METKDKSTIYLLICEMINHISMIFLDTFLVAYFFQINNKNITVISLYYLIGYAICGIIFWLGGDIIKTKNQIKVYRYGIMLNCLYIFVIAILGDKCRELYILLGILYGISQGVYWIACHALRTELNKDKSSKKYVSSSKVLSEVVKIIVPILLGTSIELASFSKVGFIIFVITIIQLILVTKIKIEVTKVEEFNLLKYMNKLKKLGDKAKSLKRNYKNAFNEGITTSLKSTLITIIIIMTFNTSFNLGFLTTIFSIFTIIATIIFQKYYKKENSKRYIIICTVISILSVCSFIFSINKVNVIIYNLCNAIFVSILTAIGTTQRYNCVNKEQFQENLIEHQSMYEISLAAGRIVAYITLLIVGLLNNITYFKILLILVTLLIIPNSIQMYKIEKEQ